MNQTVSRILHRPSVSAALAVALLLVACSVGSVLASSIRSRSDGPRMNREFVVEVVSSAPDQVTGGDARLHIDVPRTVPLHQVRVWANGSDVSDRFSAIPGTRTLTGVIDGLELGENTVTVVPNGRGRGRPRPVSLTLTNYPIIGPVFSGPNQYPFVCTVQNEGLGQALIDNEAEGFPVYATDGSGVPTGEIIGYSRDCSAQTLVQYVYKSTGGGFKPYTLGGDRPGDIAQTTTIDGLTVDYIVRWERGTINRFIYSVAMLAPGDTSPDDLDRSAYVVSGEDERFRIRNSDGHCHLEHDDVDSG